jgi:hypothetical protein
MALRVESLSCKIAHIAALNGRRRNTGDIEGALYGGLHMLFKRGVFADAKVRVPLPNKVRVAFSYELSVSATQYKHAALRLHIYPSITGRNNTPL